MIRKFTFDRNNADLESLAAVLRQQGLEGVFFWPTAKQRCWVALGTMQVAKGLEFKAVLIHDMLGLPSAAHQEVMTRSLFSAISSLRAIKGRTRFFP